MTVFEKKKSLRDLMASKRKELIPIEVNNKSGKIKEYLFSLNEFKEARLIMSYVNIGSEVKTIHIIQKLLCQGKSVVVPVCVPETGQLIASQIMGISELAPSHYGILEPKEEFLRTVGPEHIDIVLVPGLAFDKKGNRLGYGKGYYDRFLSKLNHSTLKLALAFEFQIVHGVPVDSHDIPVDYIVTENGVINTKGNRTLVPDIV